MAGNDEHTLLLLHGEDLTDSGPYGCTVKVSDVSLSDTAKFGKSLGFNSTATMSAVLPMNLSTADFTIDWWEYRNTADSDVSTIFTFGSKSVNTILAAYNELNSGIKLYASSAGSGWDVANGSIGTLVKNKWVHRAIVRTGGKIYAYQDGVLKNTFSGASKIYAPDNIITFSQCFGGGYLNGYIDEFRVSDIARWTENFTPPSEPYSHPAPPSAPTDLQQTMAVRLAWSAVDGASGYNVYRDGTLLTSTTETTYIDLTAAENTEYVYAVSAVGTGGESAKTTLTVYTKSGYFLYKPVVESATFQ